MVTNIWFGFFWHGLANIPLNQVFSNKARSGTKKCNQQLAKKKSCTLKKKKHPRITPSFSNLFASILFLSLSSHFASLHTQYPMAMMITRYPISSSHCSGGPGGPHQGGRFLLDHRGMEPEGFSPRLDISDSPLGYLGWSPRGGWSSWSGQKRAVLRGGIGSW